jgi:hypothetical protein
MITLRKKLNNLRHVRDIVETKNKEYYEHVYVNNNEISDKTISIVMTSHERSRQVYYTLFTINKCTYKDIQVIIVDDSINDKINIDKLKEYTFNIELISIKKDKKCWANPCINYNIGFQYIKGGKVIIQNSEVCYIGDILGYVANNVVNNKYYVFDVKASRNFETNDKIYDTSNIDIGIYNTNLFSSWYQHYIYRNVMYHFLVAMTRDTFNKINLFSYDYAFGSCYDDDDYVLKVKYLKIEPILVKNDENGIGGIHLFHGYTHNITDDRAYRAEQNQSLFLKKQEYINKFGKYLEISDGITYSDIYDNFNSIE